MSVVISLEFLEDGLKIGTSVPLNPVLLVGLLESAKLSILQQPETRKAPEILVPKVVPLPMKGG